MTVVTLPTDHNAILPPLWPLSPPLLDITLSTYFTITRASIKLTDRGIRVGESARMGTEKSPALRITAGAMAHRLEVGMHDDSSSQRPPDLPPFFDRGIPHIRRRLISGEPRQRIADSFSVDIAVIDQIAEDCADDLLDLIQVERPNPKRKIPLSEYETIDARKKRGDTLTAIAADYGVSIMAIRHILDRQPSPIHWIAPRPKSDE